MDPVTIFFAALAGFICFQLYQVLGRRDGHEPEEREAPLMRPTVDATAEEVKDEPQPEESLPDWVNEVKEVYPDFDEPTFLQGAGAAYEMIVESFAGDNLSEVKSFIAPSVYKAFETAVSARKNAGHNSEVQFVGIEKSEVLHHEVSGGFIRLTVSFLSNQIRMLKDKDGNVVEGNPNRIDLVKDNWTFSRSVNSNDPNWLLTETGGYEPAAK